MIGPFHSIPPAVLVLASLGAAVHPATEVCGTLRSVTEWTAAKSPYLVTGDLFIPNTSRLRIGPGVVVRFAARGGICDAEDPAPAPTDWSDSAYVGIRIEGPFQCMGSEEKPIVFEPADPKAGTVGWDGLRISGHTIFTAEVAYAVFRGANQAIHAEKSSFFVHHCLFEGNNTGIALAPRGDLSIVNSNFMRNHSAGITVDKARPRIAGNLFADNRSYGIWADSRFGLSVSYNAFWNNGEEHCFRCPASVLKATGTVAASASEAASGTDAGAGQETRAGKGGQDTAADAHGNRVTDPVFQGSDNHKSAILDDEASDTPAHLVKDKEIAKLEAANRSKWAEAKAAFKPQGTGPYRLSVYSKLIDAGPPGVRFKDRDGSRNDIGLMGGPQGHIAEDPF